MTVWVSPWVCEMSIRVNIPMALRQHVDGLSFIELEGTTVHDLLNVMTQRHPGLTSALCGPSGALRDLVHIYINDDDICYLAQEHSQVEDGDVVTIVSSVPGSGAGGSSTC